MRLFGSQPVDGISFFLSLSFSLLLCLSNYIYVYIHIYIYIINICVFLKPSKCNPTALMCLTSMPPAVWKFADMNNYPCRHIQPCPGNTEKTVPGKCPDGGSNTAEKQGFLTCRDSMNKITQRRRGSCHVRNERGLCKKGKKFCSKLFHSMTSKNAGPVLDFCFSPSGQCQLHLGSIPRHQVPDDFSWPEWSVLSVVGTLLMNFSAPYLKVL